MTPDPFPTKNRCQNGRCECVRCDLSPHPEIDLARSVPLELKEYVADEHMIVCVREGVCELSIDDAGSVMLYGDNAVFLHSGCRYRIECSEDTVLFNVRFNPFAMLCRNFSLYGITTHESSDYLTQERVLSIHRRLMDYLVLLSDYFSDGIDCVAFRSIKARELIYILRYYYPVQRLAAFFSPLMNGHDEFVEFVHSNWMNVRNVKQLAEMSRYSINSFSKKFRKVFDIPPSVWLNRKRAERVYKLLTCTNKPFKEISRECDFATVQQFSTFCRRFFGDPPGTVRANIRDASGELIPH